MPDLTCIVLNQGACPEHLHHQVRVVDHWSQALDQPSHPLVAFINPANHYPPDGLTRLALHLEQHPELEMCLATTQYGRAYLFETMVCRRRLLEEIPPDLRKSEAQWFVESERIPQAFLPEVTVQLADPPGNHWPDQWRLRPSHPPTGNEACFQLPAGILHLRSQSATYFEACCLAWQPYRRPLAPAQLQLDLYQDLDCAPWKPDRATSLLPPRQQCQGLLTAWDAPVFASQRPALSLLYHPESGQAVGRLRGDHPLTATDLGKPCESLLLAWHARQNQPLFHATVVAFQGQGVLLVGPENTGKSTTAAACLAAGWDLVADDLVVIQGRQAMGIYSSCWFHPHQRAEFPDLLADLQCSPWDPKGWVPLAGRRLRQAPIRAVVWPRLDSTGAGLEKANRALILRLLLSTSGQRGPNSRAKLDAAHGLLQAVPCWHLPLQGDLAAEMERALAC